MHEAQGGALGQPRAPGPQARVRLACVPRVPGACQAARAGALARASRTALCKTPALRGPLRSGAGALACMLLGVCPIEGRAQSAEKAGGRRELWATCVYCAGRHPHLSLLACGALAALRQRSHSECSGPVVAPMPHASPTPSSRRRVLFESFEQARRAAAGSAKHAHCSAQRARF